MSNEDKSLIVYRTPGDLSAFLKSGESVIKAALPKHLNPDRMLRLALTAFSTTPALRQCTGHSILASIVIASQLGLEPGVRGQGYLIPYQDRRKGVSICTFVPGWQGLVGLLNNSGRATIWTGAVYKDDVFEFELGAHPKLRHVPMGATDDPNDLEWVYACGKVNGSEHPVIEAWPMPKVWAHRDRYNKVGDRHYSFVHPEMYARKVVLLQVLKYMPSSIEVNNAIVAAEASELGRNALVEGGVVFDIDPGDGMAEGAVGSQQTAPAGEKTLMERAQSEKKKADPTPTPEKDEPKGPTAADLLKSILAKGAEINAGRLKIQKTLIALKVIGPDEILEKLDPKKLAEILDAWDTVKEGIFNPE